MTIPRLEQGGEIKNDSIYFEINADDEKLQAEHAQKLSQDIGMPLLRETMTIMIEGKPVTVYKDEIENSYTDIYTNT